jgi:hypothetical protein
VVTGAPDRFLVALEDQTCDGIGLGAGDCVVVTQDLRHDGPALLVTFTPNPLPARKPEKGLPVCRGGPLHFLWRSGAYTRIGIST